MYMSCFYIFPKEIFERVLIHSRNQKMCELFLLEFVVEGLDRIYRLQKPFAHSYYCN